MHMKHTLTASAVTLLLAFSSIHAAPGSGSGAADTTTQDTAALSEQGPGKMKGRGSGMMGKCMRGGGHGMMGKGMQGGSHGMMGRHKDLTARLDLMEARLAKMETLLERMSQR